MALIEGTGDDELEGTELDDETYGFGGTDTIRGLGGDDYIDPGQGGDQTSDDQRTLRAFAPSREPN